jgi:lipopolysaccharide transport system permease protein
MTSRDSRQNQPVRIIEPRHRWWKLNLADAWAHRELLWLLMWRNVTTRYSGMALGFTWAFLEPLALLLTLAIVFGVFIRVETPYPYPIFVFTALIPWLLFTKATMDAASCLQEHMGLISKVYFPRILLPFASVFRDVYDSIIIIAILIMMGLAYGYPPTWRLLFLPLVLAYVTVLSLAIGLWVAGLMVEYRDLRPFITIVMQLGFYFSPILFPPAMVPDRFFFVYQLNPMYWGIEFSRWAFLGQPVTITAPFFIACTVTLLAFVGGLFVFAYHERASVDAQ